jgi:hypothetical protein
MQNPAFNARYSVVQINSSLLTITLYSPVRTTLAYNDTIFHDVITEFDCTVAGFTVVQMEHYLTKRKDNIHYGSTNVRMRLWNVQEYTEL